MNYEEEIDKINKEIKSENAILNEKRQKRTIVRIIIFAVVYFLYIICAIAKEYYFASVNFSPIVEYIQSAWFIVSVVFAIINFVSMLAIFKKYKYDSNYFKIIKSLFIINLSGIILFILIILFHIFIYSFFPVVSGRYYNF